MITAIRKLKGWLNPSLTCEEVNHFIVEYLEGALPSRPRALFEGHIARCPNCRPFLDQYRQTIEMVREAGADVPEPPEELVEATMTFLRQHAGTF